MKTSPAIVAVVALLISTAAQAQKQAAGLWEHAFTMKTQSGEMEKAMADMQQRLAAMPPAQRQQIEAAMAARGIKVGVNGTSAKVCVSKEEAARPAVPRMSGDCTQKDVQRSGNTMSFKFECTKPQASSGEGEVTFTSDKAYTGKSTLNTQVNGQPQQMTLVLTGQWLAADCGEVKPAPAMPP